MLSIPFKFPWLSSKGTARAKRKFASGATVACALLVGVIHGSEGITQTLFAGIVAGGKE
jgi:hypothetical protein